MRDDVRLQNVHVDYRKFPEEWSIIAFFDSVQEMQAAAAKSAIASNSVNANSFVNEIYYNAYCELKPDIEIVITYDNYECTVGSN